MVFRKALTVLLVVIPVVATVLATRSLYRKPAAIHVDFERGYEGGTVSGFHPRERVGTLGFRWTSGDSYVRLRYLPMGGNWDVGVRVKALPFPEAPRPTIRFSANGVTAHQAVLGRGLASYRFTIPATARSLTLGIHSPTFTTRDGRTLGVQVFSIDLQPKDATRPSTRVLPVMGAAAAVFLIAALSAGLSLPFAAGTAALLATGFIYLLAQKSVRFTAYPLDVLFLALGTLVFTLLLRRTSWPPVLRMVVTVGLLLKATAITYPLFLSSDAAFQANRLRDVLGGNFYPTSVTQHQPPFLIPYPVSLYVLTAPLAVLGFDPERALEWTTALADASVAVALFCLALRYLADARAGVLAAALYPLIPINVFAFSAGNFTNLFGVAMTTLFLWSFLALWDESAQKRRAAATFDLCVVALTSHLSVFLYAILLWPAWLVGVLLVAPPGRTSRFRVAIPVLLGVIAALAYYTGYWDLMASQTSRLAGREYAAGKAEISGPLAKLAFNFPFYREWLGEVFAILVLLGAVSLLRNAGKSALHVAAAAWLSVTGVFLVLDLFTPLEIRYVLQATPLFALFAGHYLSGALERGRLGRLAAWVAVFYVSAMGLWNFKECLISRYH